MLENGVTNCASKTLHALYLPSFDFFSQMCYYFYNLFRTVISFLAALLVRAETAETRAENAEAEVARLQEELARLQARSNA